MSFWVLLQVLVNLVLFAGLAVTWVRLSRPAKDDPRLSKGLQLLQSKIAVLEDLSDRTETQVSQLTALLETKCRDIQEKIAAADRQISRIDASAKKSLEVANIFQDRIPHTEIVERQNTIKYVTAARLAHQGHSVEDIAARVDLSRAEIEFIAKVNRERLQFSEEDLPEWARVEPAGHAQEKSAADLRFSLPRENFEQAFAANEATALPKLQTEFRQAVQDAQTVQTMAAAPAAPQAAPVVQSFQEIDLRAPAAASVKPATPAPVRAQTSSGKTVEVRPVLFPRIER